MEHLAYIVIELLILIAIIAVGSVFTALNYKVYTESMKDSRMEKRSKQPKKTGEKKGIGFTAHKDVS